MSTCKQQAINTTLVENTLNTLLSWNYDNRRNQSLTSTSPADVTCDMQVCKKGYPAVQMTQICDFKILLSKLALEVEPPPAMVESVHVYPTARKEAQP